MRFSSVVNHLGLRPVGRCSSFGEMCCQFKRVELSADVSCSKYRICLVRSCFLKLVFMANTSFKSYWLGRFSTFEMSSYLGRGHWHVEFLLKCGITVKLMEVVILTNSSVNWMMLIAHLRSSKNVLNLRFFARKRLTQGIHLPWSDCLSNNLQVFCLLLIIIRVWLLAVMVITPE